MISALQKLPDTTVQLTITIPKEQVKKAWDEITEEAVKYVSVPGFRKGKVPKKIAVEQLSKDTIREEVLKKLLPQAYVEAVKEHNLKPFINPRIHVEKIEADKDWQFSAVTCEAPAVTLTNYKEEVRKITAKSKIIVPGKEPLTPNFDDVMKAILASTSVTIPSILIEGEVDKLLSQMLDEIKRLGLSLDQYLASTGKTSQALRDEYKAKAENDIKLELALGQIAQDEHIAVEEKEIDEAILKAKDEKERQNLQANRYLLAQILRQQKTLDFLRNL